MLERMEYIVEQIDGDYAWLKRIDKEEADNKMVARALLPAEMDQGSRLVYECMEYSVL